MRTRELPKTFDRADVARLMATPNMEAPTGVRNRAMMETMYRAGLRVGETCQLHIRDLKSGQRIHLRSAITKGKKERWVPMSDLLAELIERWKVVRKQYAAGSPLLFTTLKATPVTPHYCWQMMQRYGRRADIEGPCRPHMLRHTCATELLDEGWNIREIQELLGHSKVETTQLYTHISQSEMARKMRGRR